MDTRDIESLKLNSESFRHQPRTASNLFLQFSLSQPSLLSIDSFLAWFKFLSEVHSSHKLVFNFSPAQFILFSPSSHVHHFPCTFFFFVLQLIHDKVISFTRNEKVKSVIWEMGITIKMMSFHWERNGPFLDCFFLSQPSLISPLNRFEGCTRHTHSHTYIQTVSSFTLSSQK